MSYSVKVSKYLSYVLRHAPETIGLQMDSEGWVDIDELVKKAQEPMTRQDVERAVELNEKQRFAIKGNLIRANQGHSIDIELNLEEQEPPEYLYHGTPEHKVVQLVIDGIKKMDRQHVHLSADQETARIVGARRGKPRVLQVEAQVMFASGCKFYRATNGVWLTDYVAPIFIN